MLGFRAFELNFPGHYDRHLAMIEVSEQSKSKAMSENQLSRSFEAVLVPSDCSDGCIPPARSSTPPLVQEFSSGDFVKIPDEIRRDGGSQQANLERTNKYGYRGVMSFGNFFASTVYHSGNEYRITGLETALHAAKAYDAQVRSIEI